jgi:hypothetical protein
MQIILVSVSYAIGAGMLWKKEKTSFYFIIVLAVAFGGPFEPLYNEATMLYFYSLGIWSLFSSFDIPQPIWVYSGYVTLYAPIEVFLVCAVPKGLSRLNLFKWVGLEPLTSCAFEMIGINGGAYEFWEPYVFRSLTPSLHGDLRSNAGYLL